MDHIRIHCLWPLFQPNPTLVSASMLARLTELVDEADAVGLGVVVTVFNGWLSGFDFRPAWIASDVNMFTDPATIDAQRLLITEIGAAIGHKANVLGLDVANEPSVLRDAQRAVTSQRDGDAWLATMLVQCEESLPGRMHTVGMDHVPWLADTTAFSRAAAANVGDVASIHAWIFFTGALERYGASGTGTRHLPEFMLELAKAFAVAPERPVWLQEYGLATDWILGEEDRRDFVERATRSAAAVSDLWGITWWCSHDIDRALSGFAELEYDLGLITVDNVVKPLGAHLASVVAAIRAEPAPTARSTALVLPDALTPDLTFADSYFDLIDHGIAPAIVLESRVNDAKYLAERGIESCVWPRGFDDGPAPDTDAVGRLTNRSSTSRPSAPRD